MIREAKLGSEKAFRLLVEKYKKYLFKIVFSVLRNEKDAEDATQEAFIKIYYALPNYENQGFKTWITRIAMNHSIDTKRKQQRQKEQVTETEHLTNLYGESDNTVPPLIRKQEKEFLQKRIDDMPANYREVILAYYITEKSYQEIAAEQQVEVKTVETKLYRARKWMRAHWKEEDFY
ncbi:MULTISPECIES: sigma-70 family RNA polymerase sigma factor [Bacillus]|uniref:sigma-70 family RNA polymerase sigma factor n=1 Tax=Bacillus TaxID=1386 RepID=UPI001D0D1F3F|nr:MULTISPECIES: sigma-70 family RNA polymerase sigma factor [Bacillus]